MAARPLALRILAQKKIRHEVLEFDPSIRSAGGVAEASGLAPELVYKTLVVERDPPSARPYLVMAPAGAEVDLRVLAAAVGVKKLRMASHRDAERYTGLEVGGISALALAGRFDVLIDERALALAEIAVSAGRRGMDVRLAVTDLIALTGARPCRLQRHP
jgi:Cys-tRNA(Pro)/Cys-tRNA(Cys) deacylase